MSRGRTPRMRSGRESQLSAVRTVTSQPAITWSNSRPPAERTTSVVVGAIAVRRGLRQCLTEGSR